MAYNHVFENCYIAIYFSEMSSHFDEILSAKVDLPNN